MRLLNRAAQRYLLQRGQSTPLVGYPGPDLSKETDWQLVEVGASTAILSSSEPGLCLCPREGRVTLERISSPADGAWWAIQPADGDFVLIVAGENREMALAVDLSGGDGFGLVTQPEHNRSAMWLLQPECVADARSVHLRYETPTAVSLFYNELCVEQSSPGTFFCIAGFGANAKAVAPSGYAGVQHRADGSLIAIFSVWHRMADQATPVDDATAIVLGAAPQAETTRFSGEGAGSSIRMPYQWTAGADAPVRLAITAEGLGSDTAIAAYVAQGSAPWSHIGVILRAATSGALLGHHYAFVEDFLRNGNTPGVSPGDRSPYQRRSGVFQNPWFALAQQSPAPVSRAQLTAYSPHPLENVAAAPTSPTQFGLRVATGTRTAAKPPPIGMQFTDAGATERNPPDLSGVSRY